MGLMSPMGPRGQLGLMKDLEIPHQPIDNLRYNLLSLRQYPYIGGQRPWHPHHHPTWQAHTPRYSNK